MWVSDSAAHFKNRLLMMLGEALGVDHHFAVANSAWTNGTVERFNREIIRTCKALLNENRKPLDHWLNLIPLVQWALNTSYRKWYASTPYELMMGRKPPSGLHAALRKDGKGKWLVDSFPPAQVQAQVREAVRVREELLTEIAATVKRDRDNRRKAKAQGTLAQFRVGDFVLVARPRRPHKLSIIWTGPWRVALGGGHVYTVEDLVTGARVKAHVARIRPYADSSLHVTGSLKEVITATRFHGELEMNNIVDIGPLDDGSFSVLVDWKGLEQSWEPVSTIYSDAPEFLTNKLKKMGLPADVRRALKQRHGMCV